MFEKMSEWKDRFAGRPAAVLGGGPSLPSDMARLPQDCVLIAVNYHAFYFCKPDFMVYNDQPENDPMMVEAVRKHEAVLVSSEPTSDILFDVPVWTGFFSSNTATWFGCWLGCSPVLLCGMDCYQGEVKYCHPCDHDAEIHNYPLEFHLRPWIESAKALCTHAERIRAVSGPLASVFGLFQPLPLQDAARSHGEHGESL